MKRLLAGVLLAGLLAACPNGEGPKPPPGDDDIPGSGGGAPKPAVRPDLQKKYDEVLADLSKHDQTNDWSDGTCSSVAERFLSIGSEIEKDTKKQFPHARYNAGITYQRCKNPKAKELFEALLKEDATFHRARVQVALYKFEESGQKDVDGAVGEMRRAITDAEFKNEEALVNLAMLQMRRDGEEAGSNCANDFECAKLNLRRALAINDSFMPAFNQLAVYYLETAKKKAGRKSSGGVEAASSERKKADTQALELAALVCSQAIRKNPRYAPVHNTSGLIGAELGDLSAAAQAFGLARKLDPKFFEAHMNYAAVNLQFRGFTQAEEAYRAALKLRPDDYEAHLGLALAIRGSTNISDADYDKKLAEVDSELAAARKIDGARPETYYNEAILTQEFKARFAGEGEKAEPVLTQAKGLYAEFVKKAGEDPRYADAVTRATERMEEIDQIIAFNKQTRDDQKQMEEMRKQQEAAEQLKKDEEKP